MNPRLARAEQPGICEAVLPVAELPLPGWRRHGHLDRVEAGRRLSGVTVEVGDLGAGVVAVASGSRSVIDATAAGWGWSVQPGGTAPRLDLFTAVLHVLGLDHDDAGPSGEGGDAERARGRACGDLQVAPWRPRGCRSGDPRGAALSGLLAASSP